MLSAACAPSPAYVSGFNRMIDPAAEAAIQVPGAQEHPKYPEALVTAVWLAVNRGDPALAARHCDDASEAARRGTARRRALPLGRPGATAGLQDVSTRLVGRFDRAVHTLRARDHPELPTLLANSREPALDSILDDAAAAIPVAEEALDLARRIGGPHVVAIALASAGTVLAESDPHRALA